MTTPSVTDERVISAGTTMDAVTLRVGDLDLFTTEPAEFIVAGKTTKQIAQALTLSPRTVEFFRASLLRKTQSPNSAALASALTRIGFHAPDA